MLVGAVHLVRLRSERRLVRRRALRQHQIKGAHVDRADDVHLGIRTSALTFGRWDRHAIAACYAANLLLLAAVGQILQRGACWMLGLAVAGGIALFHLRLIAEREPAACFRAFLHNVWYGAAIFIGIALDYGLQP